MSFFKRARKPESEPAPASSKGRGAVKPSIPTGPSLEAISAVYNSLKTPEDDAITLDGIMAMGEHLGIDPAADVAILAFAWKCECAKGIRFTQEEFTRGMVALNCETLDNLRDKVPELRASIHANDEAFKSFYRAAFKLSCEASQKTLAPETAVALLAIVFPDMDAVPHISQFSLFLSTKPGLKRVTLDEWCQLLTFSRSVLPDLTNYDESAAWPVLLDEFVEWKRKGK